LFAILRKMFGKLRCVCFFLFVFSGACKIIGFLGQPHCSSCRSLRFCPHPASTGKPNVWRSGYPEVGFCCRWPVRKVPKLLSLGKRWTILQETRGPFSSSTRFSIIHSVSQTTWILPRKNSLSHFQSFRLGMYKIISFVSSPSYSRDYTPVVATLCRPPTLAILLRSTLRLPHSQLAPFRTLPLVVEAPLLLLPGACECLSQANILVHNGPYLIQIVALY